MSLILGGWLYRPEDPIAHTLQKMYESLAALSHTNFSKYVHHNMALGHLLTHPIAPDQDSSTIFSYNSVLLTAQGRIDNLHTLCKKLEIEFSYNYTTEYLIWKSFLKWGKNCIHELRGDWSFAVFNFETQELFLARDPMGYTALYYYHDNTGFYFSSSIKSLLSLPSYHKQINEEYWLRMLTLWDHLEAPHLTFFKNIYSVPVGHTLLVKQNGTISLSKYWFPQTTPIRYYKNTQTYAEEMYELFSSAVAARLRHSKPVASMLSGGLDSSAVSYVAASHLKHNNTPLTTFSHVPLFTHELQRDEKSNQQILDESPFILETVKASGNINPIFLNSAQYSIMQGITETLRIYDAPTHGAANLFWLQDIFQSASKMGFGALLTGEGGNGSISFKGFPQLMARQWKHILQHPLMSLKSYIARPIVKILYPKYFDKRRFPDNDLKNYVHQVFANEHLLQKYQVQQDIIANNKSFRPIVKDINEVKELFIGIYNIRSTFGAANSHFYGFELRDPCTDQELMEYFFSIPNEVFFDKNLNNRMLVKRMMKGKLPDMVLLEKKKGLQSADIVHRAKAEQKEISTALKGLKNSQTATHYIDINKLSETWQRSLHQPYTDPFQMQCMLKAIQFGMFLQMHFD